MDSNLTQVSADETADKMAVSDDGPLKAEAMETHPTTTTTTPPPFKLEGSCIAEKIIFCIDHNLFRDKKQAKSSATVMNAILDYMDTKMKIATKTPEFSLMLLNNNVIIPLQSCKMFQEVAQQLDSELCYRKPPATECNLDNLFATLAEDIPHADPEFYEINQKEPPFVHHAILLLGNNFGMPFSNANALYFLLDNPYFTLDILYVKDAQGSSTRPERVAAMLSNLVKDGKGFLFEVDRGSIGFHMRRLLAHTMIRPAGFNFNAADLK